MSHMNLKTFVPGTCIMINDIMTGTLKLGEVVGDGQFYIDLGNDPCPFPIYAAIHPVAIGNTVSWHAEAIERNAGQKYVEIEQQLIDTGIDRLTRLRALYWCSTSGTYDYAKALQAGREATATVAESRKHMDDHIRRAASATKG